MSARAVDSLAQCWQPAGIITTSWLASLTSLRRCLRAPPSPTTRLCFYSRPPLTPIWLKLSSFFFPNASLVAQLAELTRAAVKVPFRKIPTRNSEFPLTSPEKLKSRFVFLILIFKKKKERKVISLSLMVCAYWGGSVSHQIMLRAEKNGRKENLCNVENSTCGFNARSLKWM